ncbi:MAG TPA: orotate phosphoribosyltransferase [Verrucomicrobiae bacterium]|nr:orotate phosphoribosyltransferase [Verrucomicrobiae bacterium]
MQVWKSTLADHLLRVGAIKFGEFPIKNGSISPIYVDLRVLISDAEALGETGVAMLDVLQHHSKFDHICGLPYAGLPIISAIMVQSLHVSAGKKLSAIYPRKEKKEYGTQKQIEGVFVSGDTVIVIDDVITDGGAKLEFIQILTDAGLRVRDVLVVVDREQGGKEALANHGYTLHSIFTLRELIEYYLESGKVEGEMGNRVLAYLGQSVT